MSLSRVITVIMLFAFSVITATAVAQSATADADEAFRMNRFNEAIPLYKKAYSKVTNKPEKRRILFQIAESYRKSSDFVRAESAYDRAIRAEFPLPIIYLRYAETLKARGKYQEAREAYDTYLAKEPGDQRARISRDYCDTAKKWMEFPTRWQIENMKRFNSRNNDFLPTYAETTKYNVLVFTSDREESVGKKMDEWTGGKFTDIYYVTLDNKNNWSKPQSFDDDKIINTAVNEGATAFNDKANLLYFTRCKVTQKELLGCGIYTSKKMGRKWSEPEPLDIAADSIRIMHPTISGDEKLIYFVSDNLPGGFGGGDIWMARRTSKTKPFGTPENLGAVVNTSANEMFPWLRQDGVLYFASDGHPGIGGLDIFKTTMVNGEWTTPVNMGYPLNSEGDDFGLILQGLEKRFGEQEDGFMTSNRSMKGARGGDEIYSVHLPPILFTLTGTVRDAQTLQRLQGVKVELKGTDKTAIETTTDRAGVYRFNNQQILPNVTYTLIFNKEGYFGAQGKETTVGLMVSKDLIHNKNLEPIPRGPIPLPEIRYIVARWELLPQYRDSLAGLVKTMKENENIVVELISHTDFRDTHEKNDTLSLRRSRSCVEYIITQGIDPDRIIAVGRGEREPRKLDKDYYVPEYRVTVKAGTHLTEDYINKLKSNNDKEAAHQLNRRTEFRIVRNDFVPKAKNVPIDSLAAQNFQIAVNPDENMVPFVINETGEILGLTPAVVNGLSIPFIYNEPLKSASMSLEQAMVLLREAWITVANFSQKGEAILEDGTIKDGAEFTLATLTFGRNMQYKNVTVRVSHDQKQNFMVGKALLETVAPVSVDRVNSKIVFEIQ
jgi:peptidoglycan-associated lipoprotein